MRILVLAADYPRPDGSANLYYVHTRNRYYVSKGEDVTVLSLAAEGDYYMDGIPVLALNTYRDIASSQEFDVAILHAPNLRNHFLFLCKYGGRLPHIVFVFHGHEVLRCSRVYPKPYAYVGQGRWYSRLFREVYDWVKLRLWRKAFSELAPKSWFIFVSEWMRDEFIKWVGINPAILEGRSSVIFNSVGSLFETESYDRFSPKKFDFVTIRSNLDGSKYCIDVVMDIARSNPQYSFCVVGRGEYFRFNPAPKNVTIVDRHLSHSEILELLNRSSCALLPTRADAQGVMACEMATFGIPLITSDISICREVFVGFDNVAFVSNEQPNIDLKPVVERILNARPQQKNAKYFADNTSGAELTVLRSIVGRTHV